MTRKHQVLIGMCFVIIVACDGKARRPATGDPLVDALRQIPEDELVNFSLAGQAACEGCVQANVPITALDIQIVAIDDPLSTVAMDVFSGLGPFSFGTIRYQKGKELRIDGTLYVGTSMADSTSLTANTELRVPSDDGATVAATLNFKY